MSNDKGKCIEIVFLCSEYFMLDYYICTLYQIAEFFQSLLLPLNEYLILKNSLSVLASLWFWMLEGIKIIIYKQCCLFYIVFLAARWSRTQEKR